MFDKHSISIYIVSTWINLFSMRTVDRFLKMCQNDLYNSFRGNFYSFSVKEKKSITKFHSTYNSCFPSGLLTNRLRPLTIFIDFISNVRFIFPITFLSFSFAWLFRMCKVYISSDSYHEFVAQRVSKKATQKIYMKT